MAMISLLRSRVDAWLCPFGFRDHCDVAECAGQISTLAFFLVVAFWSLGHLVLQRLSGTHAVDAEATRKHVRSRFQDRLFTGLSYMPLVFVCQWRPSGWVWAQPARVPEVQVLGAAFVVAAAAGFIEVHCRLGHSWSPSPEFKKRHDLVTRGIFSLARHPMYAVFLWAAVAILLATFNWVLCSCYALPLINLIRRIPVEEDILIDAFGGRYREYQQRVGALGPRACDGLLVCCGARPNDKSD